MAFRMECDGTTIWRSESLEQRLQIKEPKLVDAWRKVPTLSFTLPRTNAGRADLAAITSRVTLWEDDEIIFHGRPISVQKKFDLSNKVVCASALGFLADPYIHLSSKINDPSPNYGRPLAYLFDYILNGYSGLPGYNTVCDAGNEIALGDTYEDSGSSIAIDKASESKARSHLGLIWDLCEKRPFAVWMNWEENNGAITSYINFATLSALESGAGPAINEQAIRFGVNLLDLDEQLDAGDVFTKIRGWDTTNSVWFDYSEAAHVAAYGSITIGRDFDTSGYTYGSDGRTMEARKYYDEHAYPVLSRTIRAVDRADLGESVDRFRVGFYYDLVSEPHGLNERVQCTKITRLLDQPDRSVYEFGQTQRTLTGHISR